MGIVAFGAVTVLDGFVYGFLGVDLVMAAITQSGNVLDGCKFMLGCFLVTDQAIIDRHGAVNIFVFSHFAMAICRNTGCLGNILGI
jgi:hypothetical protein